MNNNLGKFLPIGTVVLLKGAKKRLMITGFCSFDGEVKDKVYDYTGCLYPEGVITNKEIALFNHNQIEKIFHIGLQDNEEKQFKQKLINQINMIIQKQNQDKQQ